MFELIFYITTYAIILFFVYLGGRFGVLNKYTAGILGVVLGGPMLGTFSYITSGLGAVHLELQELSSDPNFAYTSDEQMLQRRVWPISDYALNATIGARCGMYLIGGLIAWKVPAAPFQVPWYVSLVLLGGLAMYNELGKNQAKSGNPYQELITIAAVGLVLSVLNKVLNQFTGGDFNPAVAVILALSVASLVPGAAQDTTPLRTEYAREEDQDPAQFDMGNVFTWGFPILISWVCPGLSVATCSRCLGQYTSQVANNHQEAIMEGWSFGAITLWGTMTGKTMLGELLQNWIINTPSDLNTHPPIGIGIVFFAGLFVNIVSALTTRNTLNPLSPKAKTAIKLSVAAGLLVQSFILLGPLTILFCAIGLVVSYILPNYSMRPLLLLFLAA